MVRASLDNKISCFKNNKAIYMRNPGAEKAYWGWGDIRSRCMVLFIRIATDMAVYLMPCTGLIELLHKHFSCHFLIQC